MANDWRQLTLDTILGRETRGIPIWGINPMEWRMIDRLAGVPEGSYRARPVETYRRMLEESGCTMVDQWIPTNPLTMTDQGYGEGTERTATTGATDIVLDGMRIDGPEAVVEHLERFAFPAIAAAVASFDEEALVRRMLAAEAEAQAEMGPKMLKVPYADVFARMPIYTYGPYGYEYYFMAYALYPEVMERHFSLQADYATLYNAAAARAIREAGLPPLVRLDQDLADSRGTLVSIESMKRIWFPELARCIKPLLDAGVTLIWHCDGNVTPMVGPLLDVGVSGFQGFQYEDGVDYRSICRMRARDGGDLLIVAGVSVTRTLPLGTPEDVRREMKWLVENGPRRLFLAGSSSIAPGVSWENLKALVDGFKYYREHGRG